MFYEVIFENGEVSVMDAASDEDVLVAVSEQHDRAKNGKPNGPQGATAVRVVKVLKYDRHPADWGTEGGLAADEVKASVNDLLKGTTVVDVQKLAAEVSALNHPMVAPENPHDSHFKMESTGELQLELN